MFFTIRVFDAEFRDFCTRLIVADTVEKAVMEALNETCQGDFRKHSSNRQSNGFVFCPFYVFFQELWVAHVGLPGQFFGARPEEASYTSLFKASHPIPVQWVGDLGFLTQVDPWGNPPS